MVRVGAYTRRTREISQISVANKYSKAPNSDKASISPFAAIFFTTATRDEKQSGEEKQTLCKHQSERVAKNTNHEFPDKIVGI